MPIAFINNHFPSLSGTFIYREVLKLRERGINVKTFSIRKPNINELSADSHDLFHSTVYLLGNSFWFYTFQILFRFLKQPWQCLTLLVFLMTRHFERKIKDRVRTFFHYCEGICFAELLQRDRSISHIHAHYASHPCTVAMVASSLTGVPFSFTAHAYDIWDDRLFVEDKVNAAKFVITCTNYGRQFLLRSCHVNSPEKVVTIYHGVDTGRFKPEVRVRQDRACLLSIGRLHPEKGQMNLILACDLLRKQGYNFICYIVGDGELFELFKKTVSENKLEHFVKLEGRVFQERIAEYYSQADILVLPSLKENLPNVLVESLSMGVPVVASNIAGIPEVVKNGETGILVAPDSVEALVGAIRQLLDDKVLARRLGSVGRRLVCRDFDIDRCTDMIVGLYDKYGVLAESLPTTDSMD